MTPHRTWRERFMANEAEAADILRDVELYYTGAGWPLPLQHWLGLSPDEFALFMQDPPAFERMMLEQRSADR